MKTTEHANRILVFGIIIFPLTFLLATSASSQTLVPRLATPALTASADAPVTVTIGNAVKYVLTVTDQDTYRDNQATRDVIERDFQAALAIDKIWSIQPASLRLSHRGVDGTGKHTYDFSGTAVLVPDTYIDRFIGTDRRDSQDFQQYDPPVPIEQQVKVDP